METFAETKTREQPFDEERFFARLGLGLLGLGLRGSGRGPWCGGARVAENTGTRWWGSGMVARGEAPVAPVRWRRAAMVARGAAAHGCGSTTAARRRWAAGSEQRARGCGGTAARRGGDAWDLGEFS
jgi:hypothetical protein